MKRRVLGRSRPARCRRSSAVSSRPSEARLTSSRLAIGAVGRGQRAVRVEREAVGPRRLEALAVARAQPAVAARDAAQRAQEHHRAQRRVARPQLLAARGHRADQHLGPGVGGLDRRVGGAHEPAVEMRRDGRAAAAHAARLGLQPRRQVGLVPEDVAVDVGAVAARDRRREVRVLGRVGLVARVAARGRAARPQRPGARDREHHLHAGAAHAPDRLVEPAPRVAGRVLVGAVEAGRLARRGDPRPQGEDAHDVDAVRLPLPDDAVGVGAALEQEAVVRDPDLGAGGVRRGGAGGQEQRGEQHGEGEAGA